MLAVVVTSATCPAAATATVAPDSSRSAVAPTSKPVDPIIKTVSVSAATCPTAEMVIPALATTSSDSTVTEEIPATMCSS